jgi:hypothetical protein
MPKRKSDATEGEAVTPEARGPEAEPAPEAAPGGPMPPAGAESEPGDVPAPPEVAGTEPAPAVPVEPIGEPIPPAGAESETPVTDTGASAPVTPDVEAPVVARDALPERAEEEATEVHDEEAGPSLAARALTFLVLLLVGAALGIWAAPRIAPHLPSGMQPVADWLTPGRATTEAELAALQTRIDEGLGGVDARVGALESAPDPGAGIASAVGELESRLSGEIATLRESIPQDGVALRQQVSRLESSLQGQSAELATLKDQLSGATAATGQLSQEAVDQINVYKADIEGLRAEMGTLRDQVSALAARIDEVAADADRQIATAQSRVDEIRSEAETAVGAATVEADIAQIRAAIAGGRPFAEPLDRLKTVPDMTVPAGLEAAAASGVATIAELRDSFPDAAHAAIRASILAASSDQGILSRSRAFLSAQVASRSLTPKEGDAPDAVLSRMEDDLRRDDLAAALAEAERLPSEAAAAMSDWLAAARLRANAVGALAEVSASVPATN